MSEPPADQPAEPDADRAAGQDASAHPGVLVRRPTDHPHVAELVLDRPEALNAVSTRQARSIAAATAALAADRSVRAVVLSSSAERAFCVGADLKERNSFSDADLVRQRPVARAAYGGVLDLPVPTVAAVHGFALGGGLELALACDLVVADETAVLGLPEVTVGVIPGGGGTQLLTRRIGWSRAADLVLTGRRIDAAEAERLGVVDRRVPAGQAREAALALADTIAANSPVGVRNAKRAMRLGLGVDLASGLEIEDACWRATAFSGDRAEGVAAFNEKRRPDWPGE
ncbi:MAG TPA: enoyl-CoA hydratase-related protein [Jiangellales bacterium]|nr:enoyl-CoA hydratase-related protein [Jiangellales bacterium]